MILFLNFAPINFMGGAEKWMIDMAEYVNKFEKTKIIDVSSQISSIYGRLILKRPFKNNLSKHRVYEFSDVNSLTINHFIPFTKQWRLVRKTFDEARIIYIRSELLELLLCFYFGGTGILSKTIAGLHMSIAYENPIGLAQQLHNLVYTSTLFRHLLARMKSVHVINKRDESFLLDQFQLTNVIYLPNGTEVALKHSIKNDADANLKIIFVGELSTRKGLDTIAEVVKLSPPHFHFRIIGEGPLKNDVLELSEKYHNCTYYGYVTNPELVKLYQSSDVILFPSRAEAFGLVMIEAMAQGLLVVNSPEVSLGLSTEFEQTSANREPQTFISILEKIYKKKKANLINKKKIIEYCHQNFSIKNIYPQFLNKVLLES